MSFSFLLFPPMLFVFLRKSSNKLASKLIKARVERKVESKVRNRGKNGKRRDEGNGTNKIMFC